MRTTMLLSMFFFVACSSAGDGTLPASGGKGDGPGTGGNGGVTASPDMAIDNGGGGGGGGGGGSGGGAAGDMATSGGGGGGALMKFAVFGDCRPPNLGDTSGYPSKIVAGIFALAQQKGAQFVVGTGDYMYASTASDVSAQVALFNQAKASYTAGPIYLAMGNHECTGYTDSNCPNLNETPNVQAFMKLVPSGVSTPYYRIDVPTPLGKAKLLFVAANAWSTAQQTWLTAQLADATTYTFLVRHEPSVDNTAPGVTPSETTLDKGKFTLELNGHTHEYRRVDTQHVISGNAGAPLTGGGSYGLLLVTQQQNGDINVQEIDESSGNVTDTWTVSADGQAR